MRKDSFRRERGIFLPVVTPAKGDGTPLLPTTQLISICNLTRKRRKNKYSYIDWKMIAKIQSGDRIQNEIVVQ